MSNSKPNWLSTKQFNQMAVGYWLIGQLKYQDDYTESQTYVLESLFGVEESPTTILEFLESFEQEKDEFASRLSGNYNSHKSNNNRNNRSKKTKKIVIYDSDNSDTESNSNSDSYSYKFY